MAVYVVGSLNQDVFLDVPELPRSGETLAGRGLTYAHGGKGMNQAVACALAGGQTAMVGCVGSDAAGEDLITFAHRAGVDMSKVARVDAPTGTAHILRSSNGDNCIVVTAGANGELTPAYVEAALARLVSGDVVVVQGEVPVTAIETAVRLVHASGARAVVNLAPVVALSAQTLSQADPLVVNEVEAAALLQVTEQSFRADLVRHSQRLLGQATSAIVTIGAAGAIVVEDGQATRVPAAEATRVVDTTGAGDAFVGVLAARLSQGQSLCRATASAVAAATQSVSRPGAADSYTDSFREV